MVSLNKAIGRKHSFVSEHNRTFYMKTHASFIAAGDKNSPLKHCCAKLNIFTRLTETCSPATFTEHIDMFPYQNVKAYAPRSYIIHELRTSSNKISI